ncbi:hypothetical protein OROHE_006195 [Orobanche hederae]
MGVDEVMKCVVEKLKEFPLALEISGGEVLAWFDKVFPQETRSDKIHHRIHVVVPYLIVAVVLMVFVCFCRYCCSCCCGCSGGRVKMMKAPKRNCRMHRDMFESDPKGYLGNLNPHPGDDFARVLI